MLTGLPNRTLLRDRLRGALAAARRDGATPSAPATAPLIVRERHRSAAGRLDLQQLERPVHADARVAHAHTNGTRA